MFSTITALGVATLFLVSGIAKVTNPSSFRSVLFSTYHMPRRLAFVASFGVPLAEIVLAVLLLVPKVRPIGLIAAVCLFLVFTLTQAVAWSAGWSGECGCFGSLKRQHLGGRTLLQVTLLALVTSVAMALSINEASTHVAGLR